MQFVVYIFFLNSTVVYTLLLQIALQAKFDSLEKLEEIPHHVEVLEKILLDSAMEAFNSELHVSLSQHAIRFVLVPLYCFQFGFLYDLMFVTLYVQWNLHI